MINKLKLFAVGLLGVAAAVSANAKTPPPATTELLTTVNVVLTAYTQNASTTNRTGIVRTTISSSAINNKSIITALTGQYAAGDLLVYVDPVTNIVSVTTTATNTMTNSLGVVTNTTYTYATNVATSTGNGSFAVLKGTSTIPFTSGSSLSFNGGTSVEASEYNAKGSPVSGNKIGTTTATLSDTNGWNFSLTGLQRSTIVVVPVEAGTGTTNTAGTGTTHLTASEITFSLNGTGYTVLGTNAPSGTAIVTGTVTAHYLKKE
jgi:hypothetical protein